jgi:hypothetical protein
VLNVPLSPHLQEACEALFPRITAISKYLLVLHAPDLTPQKQVEAVSEAAISPRMLETLPDSVIAMLKDAIAQCQVAPPTTWVSKPLALIDRGDLTLLASGRQPRLREPVPRQVCLMPSYLFSSAHVFRLLLFAMHTPSVKVLKQLRCQSICLNLQIASGSRA